MVSSDSRAGRSWARPAEVPIGSAIGDELSLMLKFEEGWVSGPEFAVGWLTARRTALGRGERVRERFEQILNQVFYLLDDYVVDPALRDKDDMTDGELVEKVRVHLQALREL